MGRGPNARPAFIKSDKARAYVAAALLQIPPEAKVMFDKPVRVSMTIYYASQRPDLDEALILDVMQAKYVQRVLVRRGVFVNDRLVREKVIRHGIDKQNPRAEIIVEEL